MKKRSVRIAGHPTSVSIEEEFWVELKALAESRHTSLNDLIGEVDAARENKNLSSALRVFVLKNIRSE